MSDLNKGIVSGRLTRDPETKWSVGEDKVTITRYTLASNRRVAQGAEKEVDFINCVAFGKQGEFANQYFHKGMKIAVVGRMQTGSYINKDGVKIPTFELVVEEQNFVESKAASERKSHVEEAASGLESGFMNIPDGVDDELPFSS